MTSTCKPITHPNVTEENAGEKEVASDPEGETWEKTECCWSPQELSAGSWRRRHTKLHWRPVTDCIGVYITHVNVRLDSIPSSLRQDGEVQTNTTQATSPRNEEAQKKEIQKQLQPVQEVQNSRTCPVP